MGALLLLCGMGCAGGPLLRLPLPTQRTPRTSSPESAIGRVDLGGLELPQEQVDPDRQRRSVLLARARLYESDRQLGDAATLYRDILEQDPNEGTALHRLAVVSAEQGDIDAAFDFFRKALAAVPANAELHNDFGYLCYLMERWDEAEQHLTRAVALNPEFRPAHTNLGLLAARRGDADRAVQHFHRAGCTPDEARDNLALAIRLDSDAALRLERPADGGPGAQAGFARIAN